MFVITQPEEPEKPDTTQPENPEKPDTTQPETPAKTSITCKKTTYKVVYGGKPFKINATSGSKLTYKSSSAKIVSVDKNGKVSIKGTGTATITIKAGSATVKMTVKVSPKKQSVKSAKPAKGKKLTVKWAKDKMASGYQVQISTSKNFKKIAKEMNVKKSSTTSCTFTKLKAGKKYYVRIRSYKGSGKNALYGAWSAPKQSGKIKK